MEELYNEAGQESSGTERTYCMLPITGDCKVTKGRPVIPFGKEQGEDWLQRGTKESFWGDRDIPYHDWSDSYMGVFILHNSLKYTLKICEFIVYKFIA